MSIERLQEFMDATDVLYEKSVEFSDIWVIPSAYDSLKFAFTEFAEVTDADMRNNPLYFRNNAKQLSMEDETCDIIMMLTKFWFKRPMWRAQLYANISIFPFRKIGYDEALFYDCATAVTATIANQRYNLDSSLVSQGIAGVIYTLHSMLPDNYYSTFINAKMEKYADKVELEREKRNQ